MKRYNFAVTGMAYYTDNLLSLTEEDSDYLLKGKEFIEEYEGQGVVNRNWFNPKLNTQVKLIPEPSNPHDPNAVRVEVAGVKIGYIKAGSCSQVKNLLAEGARVELSEIHYGPAKWTYEDEDGQVRIAQRNRPPFAQVTMTVGQEEVKPEPKAAPAKLKKKISGKRMAIRIGLTILGILLALLSIGAFSDTIVAGVIVLALALVSIVIGWWPR